jgi:hypothetical protein
MTPEEAIETYGAVYTARYSRRVHVLEDCDGLKNNPKEITHKGGLPLKTSVCEFCLEEARQKRLTTGPWGVFDDE